MSLIDEIVREGARRMLAEALQAEVAAYIKRFAGELDERGRRLVVGNGSRAPRTVLTSAGAVEIIAPRVNDKRGDPDTGQRVGSPRRSFRRGRARPRRSPRCCRCCPCTAVDQRLQVRPGQFLGSDAGLSAPVITRLTETWTAEQRAFAARDLSSVDYVYLWADGIHVNVRLDEHKLCLLVMIGVRADGPKEFVALTDGYRESTESWADLLRDCARRGMRAPVLAIGNGALGFWGALREVTRPPGSSAAGSTRSQACSERWPPSAPSKPPTALSSARQSRRSPMILTSSCWRSSTTRPCATRRHIVEWR